VQIEHCNQGAVHRDTLPGLYCSGSARSRGWISNRLYHLKRVGTLICTRYLYVIGDGCSPAILLDEQVVRFLCDIQIHDHKIGSGNGRTKVPYIPWNLLAVSL
jgi:hypothetical protein